jgi:hypothetical protein
MVRRSSFLVLLILCQVNFVNAVADAHIHIHICDKMAKSLDAAVKDLKKACKDVSDKTANAVDKSGKKISKAMRIGAYAVVSGVSAYFAKGLYGMYYDHCLNNAKQALLDAMSKNIGNKIGIFGFPEGCEKEVKALLGLKGGPEELTKIHDLLKNK